MTDPLALGLRQPDPRTCGAASVRIARLLQDGSTTTPQGFRDDVLALHRRLTSAYDARGHVQPPWPRAIGTPPWAVARELADVVGVAYRTHLTRTGSSARAALASRVADHPAALYLGDGWLPRHVVLLLAGPGPLRCYEPSSGRVLPVDLDDLRLGRWRRPWFVVTPS